MAEIEIMNIMWEGPWTLQQADEKKGKIDYDVYQCYGDHSVYGLDVLLRIGKAHQQRTFGASHSRHGFNEWNQAIQIYLGRTISITEEKRQSSDITDKIWDRKIGQAEKLLIHACWPAYNYQGIYTPPADCKNLLILNWGKFRSLPEAISGYRTSKGSLDDGSYRFMGQ